MKYMIEEDLRMAHKIYKYIDKAMSEATYEKLDENEFVGKISCCWGVIAFASSLEECKDELLSVLEDWILVGLRLGHPLPVVGGIDLNKELDLIKESIHEQMGTV
jgi:predicted RNase H-like HicB family nuclease